jgi:hypothetical protein
MKRDVLDNVEIMYRRAKACTDRKTEVQTEARIATMVAIRRLEEMLISVAPLKSVPRFPQSEERALRVRELARSGWNTPLREREQAWVVAKTGKLMVAFRKVGPVQVGFRKLDDHEIRAEDLQPVVSVVEYILQQHAMRCDAQSADYEKSKALAAEICSFSARLNS